jgi:hypothetical protein
MCFNESVIAGADAIVEKLKELVRVPSAPPVLSWVDPSCPCTVAVDKLLVLRRTARRNRVA